MEQAQLANLTFKNILVRGDKGQSPASVLFDTGASVSFISRDLAEKIATIVPADRPFNISLADDSRVRSTDGDGFRGSWPQGGY